MFTTCSASYIIADVEDDIYGRRRPISSTVGTCTYVRTSDNYCVYSGGLL